ncbi:hypothetical protein LCGC14_2242960 [marine sediment metagenome]|uniref:HNH nuclease domain-containing protein n=1 Tax=marine sediment metagenome TaxID=412755 RepID=A0A0F9D514_9ZZZZ
MARGVTEKLGTRRTDRRGYITIRLGKGHPYANSAGWQYEHRFVVMEDLGRPLLRGDKVVHINGDRFDNRIENLQLVAASPPPPHCLTCSC